MSERADKTALFTEFAAVGKVLGNPTRLELLDVLAQGPRSVEDLATSVDIGVSTCSAHLQTLREAGLVLSRREGKRIFYSLTSDQVVGLWEQLRSVAQEHRPHTEVARRAYLGPDDTEEIGTEELLRRLARDEIVLIDVRPEPEYRSAHLPGAVHVPLAQLSDRLAELGSAREVVAYCRGRYCVLAVDAVRILQSHGIPARRAADGIVEWRLAGTPLHGAA